MSYTYYKGAKKNSGEFYAEYDNDTKLWCVFDSESPKAHASYADKASAEKDAEKRNGLKKKASSIEGGASRLEERATKEWSRLAGEDVHVEEIGGVLYAFGSELACLRLWYKMGHGKAAPSKALVKERGPWYWRGH